MKWTSFDLTYSSRLKWDKPSNTEPYYAFLDFGFFENFPLSLEDQGLIKTLQLATEHFTKIIYTEQCCGICLFKGSLELTPYFPTSSSIKTSFTQWLKEENIDFPLQTNSPYEQHLRHLFARNSLLDFLDFIIPYLPMEPTLYLSFETESALSLASKAALLNSEIMSHYTILPQKKQNNPPLALCLPSSPWQKNTFDKIEATLQSLENEKKAYRLIPQDSLHLEWNCLDNLIVINSTVTSQLKRQCLGFEAAGGSLTFI